MKVTCQEITAPEEQQACFALRRRVFVDEQHVPPELEFDGQDAAARHFAVKADDRVVATCRVRLIGSAAKIERMAVQKDFRLRGLGMKLMRHVMQALAQAGGTQLLRLSAQVTALPFYEKLGFQVRGNEYMDADMPHYDMVREI